MAGGIETQDGSGGIGRRHHHPSGVAAEGVANAVITVTGMNPPTNDGIPIASEAGGRGIKGAERRRPKDAEIDNLAHRDASWSNPWASHRGGIRRQRRTRRHTRSRPQGPGRTRRPSRRPSSRRQAHAAGIAAGETQPGEANEAPHRALVRSRRGERTGSPADTGRAPSGARPTRPCRHWLGGWPGEARSSEQGPS